MIDWPVLGGRTSIDVSCHTMNGNIHDHARNAKEALKSVLKGRLKSSETDDKDCSRSHLSLDITLNVDGSGDEVDDVDSKEEDEDDEDGNTSTSLRPVEERRIKNRLAARRCREKRKQRIMNLEKICNALEGRIADLEDEVKGLEGQKRSLDKLLRNHICIKKYPATDLSSISLS